MMRRHGRTQRQAWKAEVATVQGALKADTAPVKADLLKGMFGALIARGAGIVSLMEFL